MVIPTSIAVGDRRIRIWVDGPANRPAVLLLHGLGRSLEDWEPLCQRLAGHRVIAVDMPGFGFSSRPAEPMSLRVLARAVAGTLDVIGETRPVHVVGNSLGGAVALELLASHPKRVARMTLVNSAGFGPEVGWMVRMLALPGIGRFAARHNIRAGARMIERTIYADSTLATNERVDHALAVAKQPDAGSALHEMVRALSTVGGVRREWRIDLLSRAAGHRRPTLIVWGDRDRILPAHQLAVASSLLPWARTRLFEGVGHMPQIECPDEFVELLMDFIASPPPKELDARAVRGAQT